jgi:hypothetical protein
MELVPAADLTKEGRLDGRLNPSSSSQNSPGREILPHQNKGDRG